MADLLALLTTALADRYAIEREVGRGGWPRCTSGDLRHERRVALKILHPELGGWAYEQLGRYRDAILQLEKANSLSLSPGSAARLSALAYAYALGGRRSEANRILSQLLVMSQQRYVSPYEIAVIYVGLGDKDRAFEWLERAYEEHSSWLSYLNVESRFDPLHSDPRFADLVRRVGLPRLAEAP